MGKLLITFIFIFLLNSTHLPASTNKFLPATSTTLGDEVTSDLIVVSSTNNEITIEVKIPWEQLHVEPVLFDGRNYVVLSLPGFDMSDQPGAPSLPYLNERFGAPFKSEITVQVVEGQAHTYELFAPVIPVATWLNEWIPETAISRQPRDPSLVTKIQEDAGIYKGQTVFPPSLGFIASDGVLRQQRVIGVNIFPIVYHPGKQVITVYETLKVIVSFNRKVSAFEQPAGVESSAYESILREELLNYEQARQWRSSTSQAQENDEINLLETSANLSNYWSPPSPGWRIKIKEEGLYKLTYEELEAAKLQVASIIPQSFQIFYLGNEIAIYVSGEADGRFDPGDYIVFYGQAMTTKYSVNNVYWLTYGKTNGKRMAIRDGTPGNAETLVSFVAEEHMENNTYYRPYAPGGDNLERWLWDYVYPSSRPSWTHSFSLTDPYTGTALLKVSMLGYLEKSISPDHHVTISINGTQVGDFSWDGINWLTAGMEVPDGILIPGNNTLTVLDPNDTGVGYDVVYIDWAALEFNSAFTVKSDELPFQQATTGTWKYMLDGFVSDQVSVYEITDPYNVGLIENINVETSPTGFKAIFQDTIEEPVKYWAMANSSNNNTYRTVQEIVQDSASNLGAIDNGADYILITPKDFWSQAQILTDFRSGQMRALQVDIQDVYDEFGYGIAGVEAIHDFLAYAYNNWVAPKPSFVVLLGDGHYDPNNYLQYGRPSFVPPYLARTDPWIGETASDNFFVTVDGADKMPDMMLGRLSVNSAEEAANMVNKIITYEQSPEPGDWQKQILAVADNTDSAGNFAQFSDDLLACCAPPSYTTSKVYFGTTHATIELARAALLNEINIGKLVINYIGHAYNTAWAQEDLLKSSDVDALANGNKLPVVLAMTCREGQYQNPDPLANNQEALSEVITRAHGRGAIASWSPTGLGVASGHDIMNRGFFDAIFKDGYRTLGKATNQGKFNLWATGGHQELLDTYLLFGDPATELILPEPEYKYLYLPMVKQTMP